MSGLADLEPAALGCPPDDRRLEYFNRAGWSSLHDQSTGKARAPCFGSKAAIAGLNQRGVSQALTETALPAFKSERSRRRNRLRRSPVAPRTGLLLGCHKTVILPTRERSIVWLNLMHYHLGRRPTSVRAFALTQQSLHLANPARARGSSCWAVAEQDRRVAEIVHWARYAVKGV